MHYNTTIDPVNTGIITVYQGATFRKQFYWSLKDHETGEKVAVDLTGATLQMQLRPRVKGDVLVDFATAGYLRIDNTLQGKFSINIPAEETAQMTFGRGVFQLEVHFPDGVVVRLMEGSMLLSLESTR